MAIWSKRKRVLLSRPPGITDAYIFFTPEGVQKIPKATVFGISFFHKDLQVWIDCENAKDSWIETLKQPYPKIFRKALNKKKIADIDGTYFVDLWLYSRGIEGMWHINKDNPCFLWVGTTIGVLLSLVIFMGYTRIHFVNAPVVGYENYSLRLFLYEFNEVAKIHNVECFCCDKQSPLNIVMPYTELKEKL